MKRTMATGVAGVLLALAGCGSGSNDKKQESVAMVIGEEVAVYPGDTVAPEGEETRISIRHEVGEEVKRVTLLEGSAQLLRGDYTVE